MEMMNLMDMLRRTLAIGGSDLFIVPGALPQAKVNGQLVSLSNEKLAPAQTASLISGTYALAAGRSQADLMENGDDDFSFSLEKLSRFRCNAYRQRGTLAATYRVVAFGLPDPEEMRIPEEVMRQADLQGGLVLVTGPAGSGKTTTLAAMIDRINTRRMGHIITIEDPIEYLHPHKRAVVSQREVPNDSPTFARALRAALRQAPDVIMVGEMRDHETMQTAITAAETGHLVLSSLHTVGAAKTIDRIIDAFPANQQQQIRIQLSMVLRAVASQRLVSRLDGGQIPVFELLSVNPAVQNLIREGKTHQIDNVIYSGNADHSMLSMDAEFFRLWQEHIISRETALTHAVNPEALRRRMSE